LEREDFGRPLSASALVEGGVTNGIGKRSQITPWDNTATRRTALVAQWDELTTTLASPPRILKMPTQDDDRGSNYGFGFFVGFLVGTVIGAALGVLVAPKSGAEVRADVREAAERSAEAFRKARAARESKSEPEKS
jgi:YtxH-like protein